MAELEYFLVAESVSVDQLTNRISLFNVVEQVAASKFPVTIPQIVAVAGGTPIKGMTIKTFRSRYVSLRPTANTRTTPTTSACPQRGAGPS